MDLFRRKRRIKCFLSFVRSWWRGTWLDEQERVQRRLDRKILLIRRKRIPVRFYFLVIFDSVFPARALFETMLKDKRYDPHILVIPDVSRGAKHMMSALNATYGALHGQYGDRVLRAMEDGGRMCSLNRLCDVVMTMNQYDGMTHKKYRICTLSRKGIPVSYIRYSSNDGAIWRAHSNALENLSYLWRFYCENEKDVTDLKAAQPMLLKHRRIIPVGSPKLDRLSSVPIEQRTRKKVIIAPHHTIVKRAGTFCIGNFLRFANYLKGLPSRYPQIDWVFRPHPLLFTVLHKEGLWSEDQIERYLSEIQSSPNCIYQSGGDYASTFMNSDGMIQDCSSFLPEYFYTGKPQCFMIHSRQHVETQYSAWGLRMLELTYLAETEADVDKFVQTVILGGRDDMQVARSHFFNTELSYNYPNATKTVMEDLNRALFDEKELP